MKITITTILFLSVSGAVAQTNNTGYTTHIVKQGETVFGITHRIYHITQEAFQKANPQVHNNVLTAGQTLYIPIANQEGARATQGLNPANNYVIHTVTKGETFASVAAKYGLTVEELASVTNPRILKSELTPGQFLIVPNRIDAVTFPEMASDKIIKEESTIVNTTTIAAETKQTNNSTRGTSGRKPNFSYSRAITAVVHKPMTVVTTSGI